MDFSLWDSMIDPDLYYTRWIAACFYGADHFSSMPSGAIILSRKSTFGIHHNNSGVSSDKSQLIPVEISVIGRFSSHQLLTITI